MTTPTIDRNTINRELLRNRPVFVNGNLRIRRARVRQGGLEGLTLYGPDRWVEVYSWRLQ